MSLRSLAMRSELLTLSGISHLTQHDGYLVQSTPTDPDFWMGNQLILSETRLSGPDAFSLFEHHFPNATHCSVVWDIPDLDPSSLRDVERADGSFDGFDTMMLQGRLQDAAVPTGITLRTLSGPDDWARAEDLQEEVGLEEGREPATYRPYLARRNKGRRGQIEKGLGQWFGAFEGQNLVAQMGMFHDTTIARYQSVETKASHRNRGICSAMLRHAALWTLGRAPNAKIVIVAGSDTDAGRLYRKMGFEHAETIYGLLRSGS